MYDRLVPLLIPTPIVTLYRSLVPTVQKLYFKHPGNVDDVPTRRAARTHALPALSQRQKTLPSLSFLRLLPLLLSTLVLGWLVCFTYLDLLSFSSP